VGDTGIAGHTPADGRTQGALIGLLEGCSEHALRDALAAHVPELAGETVVLRGGFVQSDPQWASSSARVGERAVVKFAWGRPAGERLWHEARALRALAGGPLSRWLPEVVAVRSDPVLLATALTDGRPLTPGLVRTGGARGADLAGGELASLHAALHDHDVLAAVRRDLGELPRAQPQSTTGELRERFVALVPTDRREEVLAWCDRADHALATPRPLVLVHGDLHGHNQPWAAGPPRLRTVLDWETLGLAEPEYDLRSRPVDGGMPLLTATVDHYHRLTGRRLSLDRAMAWHLRTLLGDALWRVEGGFPLPDGRTVPQWLDDLADRFAALRA
jgi:aminoglycoside phosphotransferase (APT) family kinase protein